MLKYSAGFASYRVYRGCGRKKREEIGCTCRVDLPALPTPESVLRNDVYWDMVLKLYFLSALDASEAMKNSGPQTISVCAAEEYWDIEEAEMGVRAVKHILRVKPRALIPGSIFGEHSVTTYRIPQKSEAEVQKSGRQVYREELEPLSFQYTTRGGDAACEYDVTYYAAYCDDKKLWEVCPKKQLYTIGGAQYPFPQSNI